MQQIFVNSSQFSWTRISSAQTVNVIHNVRMRFRIVEYMANLVVNRSSITAETHALIHHRQGFHVFQRTSKFFDWQRSECAQTQQPSLDAFLSKLIYNSLQRSSRRTHADSRNLSILQA